MSVAVDGRGFEKQCARSHARLSPSHILIQVTRLGPLLLCVHVFANVVEGLHVPREEAVGAEWKQMCQICLLVCKVDFTEGVVADQKPVTADDGRLANAHVTYHETLKLSIRTQVLFDQRHARTRVRDAPILGRSLRQIGSMHGCVMKRHGDGQLGETLEIEGLQCTRVLQINNLMVVQKNQQGAHNG